MSFYVAVAIVAALATAVGHKSRGPEYRMQRKLNARGLGPAAQLAFTLGHLVPFALFFLVLAVLGLGLEAFGVTAREYGWLFVVALALFGFATSMAVGQLMIRTSQR